MLPQYLLDEFLDVPAGTTDENSWNGAWNVLLNEYFPIKEGWVVSPQARPPQNSREAVDFGVLFKIERQRIPVMFVEIKSLSAIGQISARADADLQMRRRFTDFYHASPSIFTGLSAFGHMVCKFELNKEDGNRITPAPIRGSMEHVIDVAPLARWNLDLTTAEGAGRVLTIFREVKNVMLNEAVHV